MGGETKILKRVGQAGARGGCLKKEGDWNPLTNYDYTNSNLYRCWMYLFNWRFSPVGLFDILYLARDSLLKHLWCYFLLFLGRLLASLLSVCVCVYVPSSELGAIITQKLHHTAWKNIKSFHMNFFGISIVSYFLTLFKLTTCEKLHSYCSSHHMSDVHFFLSPASMALHDDQMKSEVYIASKIFRIFAKCL